MIPLSASTVADVMQGTLYGSAEISANAEFQFDSRAFQITDQATHVVMVNLMGINGGTTAVNQHVEQGIVLRTIDHIRFEILGAQVATGIQQGGMRSEQ